MTDQPTALLVRRARNILTTASASADDASPGAVVLRDLGLTLEHLDHANALHFAMLKEIEAADLECGTELLRLDTIKAPSEARDTVYARLFGLHAERRRLTLQHETTIRRLYEKVSELLTKYALLAE